MEDSTKQNKQDYKIWYPHEVFYIESMLTITRTAMADQSMLRTIIEELNTGKTDHKELVLDIVQNIITHAASISRYFWPSSTDKIHKQRGQRLREAFEINESNPIKNRNVRNFIEHFDEKLDIFLQEGIAGNIIPSHLGKRVTENEDINHFFRAYFIDEWKFHVLGQEFNVHIIINELIRIHLLLEKFNQQGGRLPKTL
jgi:hypothetical protein